MREHVAIYMLFALFAIGVLFALDRLALWMEGRGWIYWRKRKPSDGGGGGMSGLLTEFQQLVEPEVRHAIEAREQDHAMQVDLLGHAIRGVADHSPGSGPRARNAQPAAEGGAEGHRATSAEARDAGATADVGAGR